MNNKLAGGLLAIAVLIPIAVYSATFKAGEQPSIASGVTIQDDLYMAGGNVTHAGAVTGDLMAAGGSILVSGTVRGDLQAAGGNITLLGAVSDDVRVAGGNITINSAVSSDVAVLGGQINIAGSGIGGDVIGAGGTIRIDAPVAGDVRLAGGDIFINSAIAGSVEIEADKVTLGSGALISGDFTYTAGRDAEMQDGAQVKGKTTHKPRAESGQVTKKGMAALASGWLLMKLLMMLVFAFSVFYFFRRYVEVFVRDSLADPLPQLGRGFVALIVWPVAAVLLMATVIGIPIGIIALLGYAVAMIFAHFMAPVILGTLLYAWAMRGGYEVTWKTILLGVVAYFILSLIPIIGWIIQFVLVVITLGALIKIKWAVAKEWR